MPARNRILRSLTTCVAVAAFSTIAAAQPEQADPPMTPERFEKEQRESMAQLAEQFPETPARPIDALVRLEVVNGHLTATPVEPKGPEEQNFSPQGDPLTRVQLRVQRIMSPTPMDLVMAHVMRLDVAGSRALNVQLLPHPTGMNLSVTLETLAGTTSAQLIEQRGQNIDGEVQPPLVRLYMMRNDTADEADEANLNVTANNFAALMETHHDEAVAMLAEGLTALRAMHVLSGVGQAEAMAIFEADRPLEEATDREVDAIFEELRNGGSTKVPELRARLRKLGSAAAAALHAKPREGWPADLALNVDTLTADLMPGEAKQTASLLTSRGRLIDLLYSPEVAVRRGAIAHLNTLAREPLKHDVEADPYTKVPQIEALRNKLSPPAR